MVNVETSVTWNSGRRLVPRSSLYSSLKGIIYFPPTCIQFQSLSSNICSYFNTSVGYLISLIRVNEKWIIIPTLCSWYQKAVYFLITLQVRYLKEHFTVPVFGKYYGIHYYIISRGLSGTPDPESGFLQLGRCCKWPCSLLEIMTWICQKAAGS